MGLSYLCLQVFTKLLLTSLPHELGQFILDSAATAATSSSSTAGSAARPRPGDASPTSAAAAAVAAAGGAGVWLSGELCLTGPPLVCLSACLTRSAEEVPAGNVSLANFVQVSRVLTFGGLDVNNAGVASVCKPEQHGRELCKCICSGTVACQLHNTTHECMFVDHVNSHHLCNCKQHDPYVPIMITVTLMLRCNAV
jgi:hypothetical protein